MNSTVHEVAVIGAGVNGLAAAAALARLGCRGVALVERFPIGHDRGSSHGHSRITRSAYAETRYARLMAVARREDWPRLEREAGQRLIHPAPGCFFGPPSANIERYGRSAAESGADVVRLDATAAARRFPALRFAQGSVVFDDRTAGLVAAKDTLDALASSVRAAGVTVLEETQVLAIERDAHPLRLVTSRGELFAERVIVATNAWASQLVPDLARRPTAVRQTVAYLRLEGDPAASALPSFPVWAYLGPDSGLHHYGLPSYGRDGVKIARHATVGADDPDAETVAPDPAAIADVLDFAARHFAARVLSVLGTESCLYGCTPTEDFVLALHPADERIVVGAGFSGHGFKFAPLTGRILAELSLAGRTSVPEFETERAAFGWG